ncbi:MAG: hypothetical protein HYU66_24505, partial [Armatimonadetes bacterium]|nr:hypothetical protein [Armatimonadota bacterium]
MPPLALLLLLAPNAPRELIANGGFEDGLRAWSTGHNWYAKPAGAGLSAVETPAGEGRGGSQAVKLTGGGKRGIVMQVFSTYPGKYHVSAWIKCENLATGDARVLVEYLDHTNKWMRGDTAGSVRGTTDWTLFETELDVPEGTRTVHLDLLTTEPNDGVAWFDDIAMQRLPTGLQPSTPPALTAAATPAGAEGCLDVTWDPAKLSPGVVRLLLSEAGAPAGSPPLAVAEAADGKAMVDSLQVGHTYRLLARAVNADGAVSPAGPAVAGKVLDRQPPRLGWVTAERLANRQVAFGWTPHVLDTDVARLDICTQAANGTLQVVRHLDVRGLYREPRPLYCTEPWLRVELKLAPELQRLGLIVQDAAGNRSEVAWIDIVPAPAPAAGEAPWQLWTAPPTTQLPRNAAPPENAAQTIGLETARGMSAGWQILLRPTAELHRFSLRPEPLRHEDGRTTISAKWL